MRSGSNPKTLFLRSECVSPDRNIKKIAAETTTTFSLVYLVAITKTIVTYSHAKEYHTKTSRKSFRHDIVILEIIKGPPRN